MYFYLYIYIFILTIVLNLKTDAHCSFRTFLIFTFSARNKYNFEKRERNILRDLSYRRV